MKTMTHHCITYRLPLEVRIAESEIPHYVYEVNKAYIMCAVMENCAHNFL